MAPKIVAAGEFSAWSDWQFFRDKLGRAAAGLTVKHARGPDAMADALADADVAVVDGPVTSEAIRRLRQCRAFLLAGVGYGHVDIAAATQNGIAVANVPEYCTDEVADHTIALIVASARRLVPLSRAARSGEWSYSASPQPQRLSGLVVGLFGFGRIARAVSTRAAALGMRVIAYDPFVGDHDMTEYGVERTATPEDLLAASDYLSLHVHLTPETEQVIDGAALALMKKGAYLVNVSRGGLVDEEALMAALDSGNLAGACLDVLSVEPPPKDLPVLTSDRTLITPHVAWQSTESLRALQSQLADAVVDTLAGKVPANTLNDPSGFPWIGSPSSVDS